MTTEQTFDKDRVLGRIKKMMALANDAGASEGERDNALRMAHATLAKYNLSMNDAQRADTSPAGERRGEDSLAHYGYPWARRVAQAVGELFFCRYFYVTIRSDKVHHYFVGRESNVITAKGMTAYVITSILAEANRRRTQGQSWAWHTSFCKGASQRIIQRCYKLRLEAEEASRQEAKGTPGTALVLASLYKQELDANDAYLEAHHKLKTPKGRERNAQAEGFHAGREHGDRISLNRQVTAGSTTKQIKS